MFPLPFLSLQAGANLPKPLGPLQSVHLILWVKCNVSCILSEWIALFSILREHRREELGMGKGFGDSAAFAPELCAGGAGVDPLGLYRQGANRDWWQPVVRD